MFTVVLTDGTTLVEGVNVADWDAVPVHAPIDLLNLSDGMQVSRSFSDFDSIVCAREQKLTPGVGLSECQSVYVIRDMSQDIANVDAAVTTVGNAAAMKFTEAERVPENKDLQLVLDQVIAVGESIKKELTLSSRQRHVLAVWPIPDDRVGHWEIPSQYWRAGTGRKPHTVDEYAQNISARL